MNKTEVEKKDTRDYIYIRKSNCQRCNKPVEGIHDDPVVCLPCWFRAGGK